MGKHQKSKACLNGGKGKTRPLQNDWDSWRIGDDLYKMPCGYVGPQRACRNKIVSVARAAKGHNNLSGHIEKLRNGEVSPPNKGKKLDPEKKAHLSRVLKKYFAEHGPHIASDASKMKMSSSRKMLLEKRPDLHPNNRCAGNRGKMTYPEQVAWDWFSRKGVDAEHNKKVLKFFPDFLVGNVIVEIDGPRWHSAPEQVARDQKRDELLTNEGYVVHRILTTKNIENELEKIFTDKQLGCRQVA